MKHTKEWNTCDVCGVVLDDANRQSGPSERIESGIHGVTMQRYYGNLESYNEFCQKCANEIIEAVRNIQRKIVKQVRI